MIRFRAALVLVLLSSAPVWADELKTIAGKTVSGTLDKITANDVILKSGATPVSTPLAQVLDLTLRPGRTVPATEKFIEVQLADESVLRCSKITLGVKEAQFLLTSGATIKVPAAAVLTVLRDAQDDNLRSQFVKLLKSKKRTDRIFVSGAGGLNPIEGSFGGIDEAKQTIKFRPDGADEIEPALEKMQGLQFTRTDVTAEPSLCRIIDLDGSVLVASKIAGDGAQIDFVTPFGHKIAIDAKAVSRIDFNFGRLTYLSDLDAKCVEPVLLGGFTPYRKDANLDGREIMLQDKQYPKGLSMYAGADLEYALGGKYKRFNALLGVDARIAEEGQGKVTVTIYIDRAKQGSYEVSTKAPIPIAIDVKDAGSLRIVVTGSNFTNYSGHATLANAHVSQ